MSRRGKRSVSNQAVAPGVTTRQITRNAPTVCRAATVETDNRVKNNSFSRPGLSPIERAWVSSKKTTIRSFHFNSRIVSETAPIIASCAISAGAIASTLPRIIVWIFTDIGLSDTIKRPTPKKEEKISPIIASSFRRERWLRKSILPAASPPERNAPSEKGSPNIQAPATPGTIE